LAIYGESFTVTSTSAKIYQVACKTALKWSAMQENPFGGQGST